MQNKFKRCRLIPGNVRHRELTIFQRRIIRVLRKQQISIQNSQRYTRANLTSYIQSTTTRKLPILLPIGGPKPINELHQRGAARTSYIPFPLNPETRSDVMPVRLHVRDTIKKARQLITHRWVFLNGTGKQTHEKLSNGEIFSISGITSTRGKERRRAFYIFLTGELIGKALDHPVRIWSRNKTEWFSLLKTRMGSQRLLRLLKQLLLGSLYFGETKRTLGASKKCFWGLTVAEHHRKQSTLYQYSTTRLSTNETTRTLLAPCFPPLIPHLRTTRDPRTTYTTPFRYGSASPKPITTLKKSISKRLELPTHFSEVNHRTPQAVVLRT